jgi:NADH-quinone oxidoreductase subunit N
MFKSFFPEVFLSFSILLQLLVNTRVINKAHFNFPIVVKETWIQTLFILSCTLILYNKISIEDFLMSQGILNDQSTICIKLLLVLTSLVLTFFVKNALYLQKLNNSEYYTIFLIGVLSLLVMISSESLISFYISMEMQALCFYILASFNRKSVFSTEAGLKYFISGSFMSGFYLLGASIIYGVLGTLDLSNINTLLFFEFSENFEFFKTLLIFGFLLIIVTLLFKLACAPFHFWSPDVYDGAPLSSTVVFSVLPKISIFFFFIKILISINTFHVYFDDLLIFFGLLSCIFGTLWSLNQKRVKRLIIYSSIAQIGFLVALLGILSVDSIGILYFFLTIYIITSLLIWGHLILLSNSNMLINRFYSLENKAVYISDFKNFFNINSVICLSMLISFFSIAGIPPLAGFLSKMLVIGKLIDSSQILAASIFIVISSVSVYYYIRIVKIAYFESNNVSTTPAIQVTFANDFFGVEYILFSLLLFLLIFLFAFPTLLLYFCYFATYSLHLI